MLAQDALTQEYVAIAEEHGALCSDTLRVIYLVVTMLHCTGLPKVGRLLVFTAQHACHRLSILNILHIFNCHRSENGRCVAVIIEQYKLLDVYHHRVVCFYSLQLFSRPSK
jgi:hypothetical protein